MAAITQPRAYSPLSGRRYGSFADKTIPTPGTDGTASEFQSVAYRKQEWQHPPHHMSAWNFRLLPRWRFA